MLDRLKTVVKILANRHRPEKAPDVFLFSTPRSGSTWLMELIWSQPRFKPCNEPFNLRNPAVRRHLGLTLWEALYDEAHLPEIACYVRGFRSGKLRFLNINPIHRYYRPITSRLVFKIIHAGEGLVPWFEKTFNGRIVFLIRHPIAVSLSRELTPRLDALLNSEYRHHFKDAQIVEANRIVRHGSPLERKILSWCLQNVVPLRYLADKGAIVTYEQLVLDPEPVLRKLAHSLDLPQPQRMLDALTIPSLVKGKSDLETQKLLAQRGRSGDRAVLVEKWRKHVTVSEERTLMCILEVFDLNAYHYGHIRPDQSLWITDNPDTP